MQLVLMLCSMVTAVALAQEVTSSRNRVFLTPTFGILDDRDQSYGRKDIAPNYGHDFRDDGATAWQCFDAKKIRIYCSYSEDSESEGSDPELKVQVEMRTDTYMYRRGYGKTYCRDQMWVLRKILRGTPKACIAGNFVSHKIDPNGRDEWLWTFARLKSPKGDYCVFPEDEWGCHSAW